MSTPPVSASSPAGEAAVDTSDLRVRSLVEIRALLKQLVDGDIPVALTTADGITYGTSLWAEDPQRGVIVFAADPRETAVQQMAESSEIMATGYLDSVKVQFDVNDLVLVHGRSGSAFNARYPREVYRFQRRNSFRVKPVGRAQPHATLTHPALARREIDLRVVDISYTGVALMLGEDLDVFERGQVIRDVVIELDSATRLIAGLRVSHVSLFGIAPTQYRRIGCELIDLSAHAQRELQRYIDHTQRRSRLLAL